MDQCRRCPSCRVLLPIGGGVAFDEYNAVICESCGKPIVATTYAGQNKIVPPAHAAKPNVYNNATWDAGHHGSMAAANAASAARKPKIINNTPPGMHGPAPHPDMIARTSGVRMPVGDEHIGHA